MNNTPIFWWSTRQTVITLLWGEAEYVEPSFCSRTSLGFAASCGKYCNMLLGTMVLPSNIERRSKKTVRWRLRWFQSHRNPRERYTLTWKRTTFVSWQRPALQLCTTRAHHHAACGRPDRTIKPLHPREVHYENASQRLRMVHPFVSSNPKSTPSLTQILRVKQNKAWLTHVKIVYMKMINILLVHTQVLV